jgi:hypothetical protein
MVSRLAAREPLAERVLGLVAESGGLCRGLVVPQHACVLQSLDRTMGIADWS